MAWLDGRSCSRTTVRSEIDLLIHSERTVAHHTGYSWPPQSARTLARHCRSGGHRHRAGQTGAVRGDGRGARKQFGSVEQDDAVAQQAPALLGAIRHDPCGQVIRCPPIRASRLMVTHDSSVTDQLIGRRRVVLERHVLSNSWSQRQTRAGPGELASHKRGDIAALPPPHSCCPARKMPWCRPGQSRNYLAPGIAAKMPREPGHLIRVTTTHPLSREPGGVSAHLPQRRSSP